MWEGLPQLKNTSGCAICLVHIINSYLICQKNSDDITYDSTSMILMPNNVIYYLWILSQNNITFSSSTITNTFLLPCHALRLQVGWD